jgi:carboxymethylenebutenolidase
MCHDTDSRPPAPPQIGEVAAHGPTTVSSGDGTVITAYRATPATSRGASIVLLPDVRGLHPYYVDLAIRFAEAGYDTVAIDYFDRHAGPGDRGDDFDFRTYVPAIQPGDVAADVLAASALLADGDAAAPVFTVGFCLGGGLSWRMSGAALGLAGVIGFYGRLSLAAEVVDDLEAPLLMLLGGADQAMDPDALAAFTARVGERGVPCEQHLYEGAPHSYFDRSFAEWQDACADSWQRILDFTDRWSRAAG